MKILKHDQRLQPKILHFDRFVNRLISVKENDFLDSIQRRNLSSVTCCVARRPGYFYWNVYLLIFLITFIALTVYGVAPEYPQSRLQITCSSIKLSFYFVEENQMFFFLFL